jgi:hypothetical protein
MRWICGVVPTRARVCLLYTCAKISPKMITALIKAHSNETPGEKREKNECDHVEDEVGDLTRRSASTPSAKDKRHLKLQSLRKIVREQILIARRVTCEEQAIPTSLDVQRTPDAVSGPAGGDQSREEGGQAAVALQREAGSRPAQ